jgi:Zn-finger nucleic acid-binding protein
MNCPHCEDERLFAHTLEEKLVSMACHACGGHWIQSFQYWKWLDAHGKNLPEKPMGEATALEVRDGEHARVCPECSKILIRCKVGRGIEFYLDRCTNCGGIWFDKNEWQVPKSRNLHDDAHFVFSKSWQDRLIQDERVVRQEIWFLEEFGTEKYEELKQFRAWLQIQAHRSAVIAFLGDR